MRRILLALFVLVLGGMTAASWYAYDKGFTKSWRALVADEFRQRGVEVTIRRLKLDPFRGLVARDVKVFDASDRERVLAVVSEMSLGLNYANALRGEAFLDTLDLRDARLSLPVDPTKPNGIKVEISKLNARLFLPPRQIYLARAEAEIKGVRIYVAGRLINPQSFQPGEETGRFIPVHLVERILEELGDTKFEGAPPLLTIEFTGDLARPEEVLVKARLTGEKIRRRGYLLEHLAAEASHRAGVFNLQQLEARDQHGGLHAHATWDRATSKGSLQLRSDMDLPSLSRAYGGTQLLADFVFYDVPVVEVNANLTSNDKRPFQVLGQLDLKKFSYRSMMFEGLTAAASWEGERWSVRNARLDHRSGEITGDVMQTPGILRARLRSSINSRLLTPLLSGRAADWFARFNFKDAPSFEIDVPKPEPVRAAGTADGI